MIHEFLRSNWKSLIAGRMLTVVAMNHMREVRGEIAIGSEILLLPLVVLLSIVFRVISGAYFLDTDA